MAIASSRFGTALLALNTLRPPIPIVALRFCIST
jgi:hypothetical protein